MTQTVDERDGTGGGSPGLHYEGPYTISKTIDLVDLIADDAVFLAAGKVVDDDILKVIHIEAGTVVYACYVHVVDADTGSCACNIGDSTAEDDWLGSVDLATVGFDVTEEDDTNGCDNMQGMLYTSDDYIAVQFTADGTNAKFKVSALCWRPSPAIART